MNPIEIAYFKHFMLDKSEHMKFLNLYRQRRLDNNPTSFEQYLLKATTNDVILKAFAFKIKSYGFGVRSRETFDYWKEVDNAWQKYWPLMENNHSNERWWDLKATFAILRQNWDKPNFYNKEAIESTEETFKRLCVDGMVPKKPQMTQLQKELIEKGIADGTYVRESDIAFVDEVKQPLIDFSDTEVPEDEGLEFYDLKSNTRGGSARRFSDNEASVYYNEKKKNYRVVFAMNISEVIRNSGLGYAQLGKTKSGDVVIQFNNNPNGQSLTNKSADDSKYNVTINSKVLCAKLARLFDKDDDYFRLSLEQLSHNDEYINYKITLK